jgi:hypothetical protein
MKLREYLSTIHSLDLNFYSGYTPFLLSVLKNQMHESTAAYWLNNALRSLSTLLVLCLKMVATVKYCKETSHEGKCILLVILFPLVVTIIGRMLFCEI